MKRSNIKKAWDRVVQSTKNAWKWLSDKIVSRFNR